MSEWRRRVSARTGKSKEEGNSHADLRPTQQSRPALARALLGDRLGSGRVAGRALVGAGYSLAALRRGAAHAILSHGARAGAARKDLRPQRRDARGESSDVQREFVFGRPALARG